MKNRMRIATSFILMLGLLATSGFVYSMLALRFYREQLFLERETLNGPGLIVLSSFGLVLLFDIASFIWVLIRHRRMPSTWNIAMLLIGTLCWILLIVDKVMIDELGREYRLGWETRGELIILYGSMTIQFAYCAVVLGTILWDHRHTQAAGNAYLGLRDENVFLMAQIMGIMAGAIGIWMNYTFIQRQVYLSGVLILIPFYILVFMPYALTVLYWLMLHFGERLSQWYDEKQRRDLGSAGLVTLVLSVPGMACLFLASEPLSVLWFPHFLFLLLLLFSASTLIFFKYAA